MERTAAMKAYIAAYVVVFAVLVLFLLNVLDVLPILEVEGGGDPSAFALPLALFGVLMLGIIVAAAWWPPAPKARWFWLLGAIPGILFFLPDIPIIIQAITSPNSALDVVLALVVTVSTVVLIVSAILAFRDARQVAEASALGSDNSLR